MKTEADSRRLAESLVSIGNASGVKTEAIITAMDAPLGCAGRQRARSDRVHRGAEGRRPADLIDVSVELTARMLVLGRVRDGPCRRERARARRAIASGAGLERFRRIIEAQGGDPRVVDDYSALAARRPSGTSSRAARGGYVDRLDAELGRPRVGRARRRPRSRRGPGRSGRRHHGARQTGRPRCAPAIRCSRLHYRDRAPAGRGARARRRAPSPSATSATAVDPLIVGEVSLMLGILQPIFGAFVILAHRGAVFDQPPRHQLDDGRLGPVGLQVVFALIVLKTTHRPARLRDARRRHQQAARAFAGVGAAFVFGPLGDSDASGAASMTGALGPRARSTP
mgnify:CR=1 FL=1